MTGGAGRTSATRRRRRIAAILIAVLAGGALIYAWRHAGQFLAREDPLAPADAIFVMAGTPILRPLEAVDLYQQGLAPLIVLTRDMLEQEQGLAEARGVRLPSRYDLTLQLMAGIGVPDEALVTPDHVHDSTAEEAATLRRLALEHEWRRVIVVSSKYHLRRARLACRRALRGTNVQVLMRASRYDESTPAHWWRRRSDIRWVVSEYPKLAAYALNIQP